MNKNFKSDKCPLFIADAMLGRLAKKMRLLGFDVEYHRGSDEELVKKAFFEKRIILTKDAGALNSKAARNLQAVLIPGDLNNHLNQLEFVFRWLRSSGINLKAGKPRCALCNYPLISVKKFSVKNRLPAYVYLKNNEVSTCPRCLRLYWKGTHYRNFLNELKEVVKRSKDSISYKNI